MLLTKKKKSLIVRERNDSHDVYPSLKISKYLNSVWYCFVQPLTSLKKMVFSRCENLKEIPDLSVMTKLEKLDLNGYSSLVELTLSSIQNLNKLTTLEMIGCSSLETLPTGINLKSLYRLNLNGCSQLRSFPDISSNISTLFLNQTAIEEVPPCIGNFSSLESMEMWECKQLQSISPRVFKLSNLDEVYFSDCEKLTEVRWPEESQDTNLSLVIFTNCFNLNQEVFIHQSASEYLILPGVQKCFHILLIGLPRAPLPSLYIVQLSVNNHSWTSRLVLWFPRNG